MTCIQIILPWTNAHKQLKMKRYCFTVTLETEENTLSPVFYFIQVFRTKYCKLAYKQQKF